LKIAVGSDHAGFPLKQHVVERLRGQGHDVLDFGTNGPDSVDYPDFAVKVSRAVTDGRAERGVLVCGTGIGMAMTANRIPGIRAANCSSEYCAVMSRRHNDANVLTLGARLLTPDVADRIVDVWLDTGFDGGRHAARVRKISELDAAGSS